MTYTRRVILVGAFVTACAVGYAVWWFIPQEDSDFRERYLQYAALSKEHVARAYIPGVEENPVRQGLNQVLAQVLVGEVSNAERLALAQDGLFLLKSAEKQIDAIGPVGERVAEALNAMERAAESSRAFSADDIGRTVSLAQDRAAVIADIRGLSYRANYHTAQILERIVHDGGALTATHAANLNEELPKVEEQYDRRANLYAELDELNELIDAAVRAWENP